jgi:hypothetical protein
LRISKLSDLKWRNETIKKLFANFKLIREKERNRETEKQRSREREKQRKRETEKERKRETDKQRNR